MPAAETDDFLRNLSYVQIPTSFSAFILALKWEVFSIFLISCSRISSIPLASCRTSSFIAVETLFCL